MVYADLHVHTEASDGTLTLDALPEAAAAAGVDAVAVTDHDRLQPALDAPVVRRDGRTIVHGIELRVEAPAGRVDLLAYGVSPTPALEAELERIQRDRVERGRHIVACLESKLDVQLDVALERGVGRPHIARAVVDHPDTAYETIADVFGDLIGDGDDCFVAREVPTFDEGRALLAEASALVSLAHPLRYPDPEAALERCADLDAVEAHYPYEDGHAGPANGSADLVAAAIDEYDLLATGGSDAHGTTLGVAGLDREAFEPVAERLHL